MNIAIIGGGITGLTAAYKLTRKGHKCTIYEKESYLGGLAHGFKEANWDYSLEASYHHFFTNDHHLLQLVSELGLDADIIIDRPITANYTNNALIQLDSPLSLLQYPYLNLPNRLRTGAVLAVLKLNPFWKPLENYTAHSLLSAWFGKRVYQELWQPLMHGKFGDYHSLVSAAWFWARIKKRTSRLGYIQGGFQTLIDKLEQEITNIGSQIYKDCQVNQVKHSRNQLEIVTDHNQHSGNFDSILITTPSLVATKILPGLEEYKSKLLSIPHLHAQTLILETDKPIINDAYWVSITDPKFPFLAAVAHTNFIDKKNYGGRHQTYFGNYLPDRHDFLKMSSKQLFDKFWPFIKKINPTFRKSDIVNHKSFIGMHAQPVHLTLYSKIAPQLRTPITNVYLANLDSVYPWDRGTNYAVELGIKAATIIAPH